MNSKVPFSPDIFDILISKGLEPFRVDNDQGDDTKLVYIKLDPSKLSEWRNLKRIIKYYDVVWKKKTI